MWRIAGEACTKGERLESQVDSQIKMAYNFYIYTSYVQVGVQKRQGARKEPMREGRRDILGNEERAGGTHVIYKSKGE